MKKFKIVTDSNADLPAGFLAEHEITTVHLSYILEDETYTGDKQLEPAVFYDKMRNGAMATTSQVNPTDAKEAFEKIIQEYNEILCISFSSGLSGSYNSCRLAAEELMEERTDCKIAVIDSLSASMGQGMLVYQAVQMRNEGKTIDEVSIWLEENKLNAIHMFTVDDLFHLCRGGRLSKASAVMGTMINIKPILHVNEEGCLVAAGKVRGRKKSLKALVDGMDERLGSYQGKNKIIFISHGDCLEDAEYIKKLIEEKYGINEFMINYVCPSIGAHSGPGTVALFFFGDIR